MTPVCHRRSLAARALLCASLAAAARAAEPPSSPTSGADAKAPTSSAAEAASPPAPPSPGALPVAAAVVPGVLLRGAGHFAAGDRATARKLLIAEGTGLGLILVPGTALAVTGASRRFVGLLTAGIVSGFGIFAVSMLADVYGASGLGGGQPVTQAPALETAVGVVHAYDPKFSYRWFFDQGLKARLGSFKLGAGATTSLGDPYGQIRLSGGYRVWGPGPDERARDGSFVDVDLGASRFHYGPERVTLWTGDILLNGRYDLGRTSRSLAGSFAELGLGRALQIYDYDVHGAAADYNELLLARFGFGWYLGAPGRRNGEVFVGYDHRHDGLAAGLLLRGLGSGVAGHFEARGRVFWGSVGLGLEAQVGSAYVTTLSLIHRHGGFW